MNIQIHEKEEQAGKKPPLYDLTAVQPAYETRLELGRRKLRNHFGARQIALRQLHTLDGDLQTSAPVQPAGKTKEGHAGPSSILGSILKNEPRMIRPNPGGISTRAANPTQLLSTSYQSSAPKSMINRYGPAPSPALNMSGAGQVQGRQATMYQQIRTNEVSTAP